MGQALDVGRQALFGTSLLGALPRRSGGREEGEDRDCGKRLHGAQSETQRGEVSNQLSAISYQLSAISHQLSAVS
jgi:hypothetical protein